MLLEDRTDLGEQRPASPTTCHRSAMKEASEAEECRSNGGSPGSAASTTSGGGNGAAGSSSAPSSAGGAGGGGSRSPPLPGAASSTTGELAFLSNLLGRREAPRDKVFTCTVCRRCFGYKHVLQNHERTHTGEKPFECRECHKRFTRDHHLKTHMRLHTGEKPYHCTHCDRQFVQVANLRRHLRVHTGERPYACELCDSKFSDSNQLKAHMLIHKGEKPFECQLCMGRFRRRHHLMHHKCPKDEANAGKPRRGRRPRAYEASPPSSLAATATGVPVVVNNSLAAAAALSPTAATVVGAGIPPVAHSATGGPLGEPPKSRRKPRHTIRILTPQQRDLFLETEQTEPLDMSMSPTPLLLPSTPYRYPTPGVLDLSSSRSDSEAPEEEEDMEDGEDDIMEEPEEEDLRINHDHRRKELLAERLQGVVVDHHRLSAVDHRLTTVDHRLGVGIDHRLGVDHHRLGERLEDRLAAGFQLDLVRRRGLAHGLALPHVLPPGLTRGLSTSPDHDGDNTSNGSFALAASS